MIFGLALILFPVVQDYVYDANAKSIARTMVGNKYCLGYYDQDGDFVPDLKRYPREDDWDTTDNGPQPLLSSLAINQPVYEYRCGILVPMIKDPQHGLIPEVGGKIIDFKDYRYSPTARRIYNLPGRFVLKSKTTNQIKK
ncbi:MAG TPA: hypothetical protein PLN21_03640 [Gemmatales bacterium]|nr:hypothetical protein [Gemmatales bacterium]